MAARVLLVEDNPANLALMQYLLQASGYTTLTATDGRQGVVVAQRESPDVILMDLQLPIMNGYEAARLMKAVPALRGVPIIAVTAFAMVGDRDKILARGFDGYIAKPITPSDSSPRSKGSSPPHCERTEAHGEHPHRRRSRRRSTLPCHAARVSGARHSRGV